MEVLVSRKRRGRSQAVARGVVFRFLGVLLPILHHKNDDEPNSFHLSSVVLFYLYKRKSKKSSLQSSLANRTAKPIVDPCSRTKSRCHVNFVSSRAVRCHLIPANQNEGVHISRLPEASRDSTRNTNGLRTGLLFVNKRDRSDVNL